MAEEAPIGTETGPPDGGGIPEQASGAMQQGLETARRQLARVRDMLMERAGDGIEGIQTALRNLGGGDSGSAMLVDPEASAQALEVVTNLW